MNPSYLILRALAKVLHISLDTLINPDISLEDEGVNQMKMLYSSCPPEMRDTLLHHTQETVKELTEWSEKFETNRASERTPVCSVPGGMAWKKALSLMMHWTIKNTKGI